MSFLPSMMKDYHIEKINDITQTAQTWSRNPKYKYYFVHARVGGSDEYKFFDPDLTPPNANLQITMYYDGSNNAFVAISVREDRLVFSITGSGYSVSTMSLYGVY